MFFNRNTRIISSSFRFFLKFSVLLSLAVFSACTLPILPDRENGSLLVSVHIPDVSGSRLPLIISKALSRPIVRSVNPDTRNIVVTVTGSDLPLVIQSASIPDGESNVTVELVDIPGGEDRIIKVYLYDSDEVLLAEGSTTSDVRSSSSTMVPVIARPVETKVIPYGPYSLYNTSTSIDINTLGQVMVYSLVLPAAGDFLISFTNEGTPIVPAVYNSEGLKLTVSNTVKNKYTFTAKEAGDYYIVMQIPLDYSGGASFRLDADLRLVITGYDRLTDQIKLSWNVNPSLAESYTITVGDEIPLPVTEGESFFLLSAPLYDSVVVLEAVNVFGSARVELPFISVEEVILENPSAVVAVNKNIKLVAKIEPANATLASFIDWVSPDDIHVAVDKDGTITGKMPNSGDSAKVTVYCGKKSDSIAVKVVETGFGGGSGTKQDPYQIATKEQLNLVRYELNAFYIQTSDIDLISYSSWNPIGNDISPFSGVYDGNGFFIYNLSIIAQTAEHYGLFGVINNAALQKIGLRNVNISVNGDSLLTDYNADKPLSLGALAGNSRSSIISSCFSTGLVDGGKLVDNVGGLVGTCSEINFIVGVDNTDNGETDNDYSDSDDSDITDDPVNDEPGRIEESFSSAIVQGSSFVGGLVGSVKDAGTVVVNSYSTGKVAGINAVGGLAGEIKDVSFSYSAGYVTGTKDTGGLAGISNGSETACFWDIQASGQDKSAVGSGKLTSVLITASLYSLWDLSSGSDSATSVAADANTKSASLWTINEKSTYPYLRWQGIPDIPVPINARYVLENSAITDVIGNKDGKLAGKPDFTAPGVYSGNSMTGFSAGKTGNYALLPFNTVDIAGDFSVSVWVKMPANPIVGVKYMILNQLQEKSANTEIPQNFNYAFSLYLFDGKPCFWTGDSSKVSDFAGVEGDASIADGTWHHLVAVSSGDSLKLYVDGEWIKDGLTKVVKPVSDPIKQQVAIGVLKDGYNDAVLPFLGGEIDKITFFNHALTQEFVTWVRRYDSQN